MNEYKLIKDYVDDHFYHFGFYPYDIQIKNKIYSYKEYMNILFNKKIK
tara:strand:+ start:1676 stop:1819 length:144 start_codon:yes stop_codon:yes gene_type:complete